jgi:predicted protein tyrosine phosphatase
MIGTEREHASDEEEAQSWEPDLHWLTDLLAVGGCFPMERARELAREHGIRSIIDLRGEACDDAELLSREGIEFLHLPTTDQMGPSREWLERGVEFAGQQMRRGNRVLIHCQEGIGRSPLLALCVLVAEGHEPLAALSLAKDRRELVSPSRAQYLAWADWLTSRGQTAPDYHSFGCIAYRHLASG